MIILTTNGTNAKNLSLIHILRDVYDMALIRLATRRNIPMVGICRGEQLINVAFGGTLYQDIPTQHPDTTVCHQQQEPSSIPTHTVHLTPGSAMASITGLAMPAYRSMIAGYRHNISDTS